MTKRWYLPNTTVLVALVSAILIGGAFTETLPLARIETIGFVTGIISVYLAERNHWFNWSVGIINSVAYIYVFASARLFADTGLQVLYVVLGMLGWYWWVHRDASKAVLPITDISKRLVVVGCAFLVVATPLLLVYLQSVNDSAPFLDALTTALSLVAQYLLCRRIIQNWYVWAAADLIYIPLYLSRGLPLTAVLYVTFLAICIRAMFSWRDEITNPSHPVYGYITAATAAPEKAGVS